jgi:hypothetical protein
MYIKYYNLYNYQKFVNLDYMYNLIKLKKTSNYRKI